MSVGIMPQQLSDPDTKSQVNQSRLIFAGIPSVCHKSLCTVKMVFNFLAYFKALILVLIFRREL